MEKNIAEGTVVRGRGMGEASGGIATYNISVQVHGLNWMIFSA